MTELNEEHPKNIDDGILVSPIGIVIEFNVVQEWKTAVPTVVTVEGMEMEESREQLWKA